MLKNILVLVLLGLIIIPQFAGAEETKPIQLAIFDPIQLVPKEDSIKGVRLSLFYTANKDVTGLSFAWMGVNRATGDVNGIEWGRIYARHTMRRCEYFEKRVLRYRFRSSEL